MRGENDDPTIDRETGAGSSPHARGKRDSGVAPCGLRGLIPACAGKTDGDPRWVAALKAHPRMRGENHALYALAFGHMGSSPHARGKL